MENEQNVAENEPQEGTEPEETATQEQSVDVAALQAQLREAQEQIASFQDAEAARKKAQMSELERAQAELTEAKEAAESAQNQLQQERIDRELMRVAADLDFREDALDDVLVLVDRVGLTLEDGKVSGAEAALKALAEKRPHWMKPKQPSGLPASKANNGGRASQQQLKEAKTRAKKRFGRLVRNLY